MISTEDPFLLILLRRPHIAIQAANPLKICDKEDLKSDDYTDLRLMGR